MGEGGLPDGERAVSGHDEEDSGWSVCCFEFGVETPGVRDE